VLPDEEKGARTVPNSLIAAAWGAFACMAVLGTPPAAASSIIYNVN
jgi:hypothetical protein